MNLNPTTRAILETIKGCGFTVTVRDGWIEAVDPKGERFIVTGDDVYLAAVELAGKCGVDVMDG